MLFVDMIAFTTAVKLYHVYLPSLPSCGLREGSNLIVSRLCISYLVSS